MNRSWLVLVAVLIADTATGVEASTSADKPVDEDSPSQTTHRFEVLSADPVEHGERLSAVLGCIGCHLPELTGDDWSDPDLGVLWTANLTRSASKYTAEELFAMITEGRRPDRALMDMPSYLYSDMHADDLTALVGYLKSLPATGDIHPEPTIGPQLAKDIANGSFKDSVQMVAENADRAPPDMGPRLAFGRFIARATCAECHGMDLRGSAEKITDAPPRPSLRMIGAYSAEDFSRLMNTGRGIGDRELKLMGGVARWRYSRLTDLEVEALYNYLFELARTDP